jgi:predicted permease
MTLWRKLAHLIPSVRRAAERDMRDELDALREIAGPGELGNLTLAAEDARAAMGWITLERLAQDIRYGLRALARDKVVAATAVASLALGIGANTAIYSFFDSVLLRPLPVEDPGSLVIMRWQANGYTLASRGMSWSTGGSFADETVGTVSSSFPFPALKVFEERRDVLASAFGYFGASGLSVTAGNATESLLGQYVSGGYFHGMGVVPAAGRLLQPSDDGSAPAQVAVVSHRFSVRRLGGPQAAIGQTIRVDDVPYTVVGVAPEEFFGAEPGAIPDVYLPLAFSTFAQTSRFNDEHFYWLELMGRLQPGVTRAQAQARLEAAFGQFVAASATTDKQRADLPRLRVQAGATGLDSLRRKYALPIYVLMAMVGLILAIACCNVANLLLARGAARRREIAIRLSVGAGRWRVVRQLLTESILLSSIGGALGVAFAWWGIRVLTALLSNGRENFTLHAEVNWNVLAATTALSVAAGVLFGLAPALQSTRVDLAPALKDAGGRDTPVRRGRLGLGWALVVVQVAFSLLLLVSAALFDRTVSSLHAIPLGFNRDHVLLFTIRPSAVGYEGAAATRLFASIHERLRRLPGVIDVGISQQRLPSGGGTGARVTIDGLPPDDSAPYAVVTSVGPEFFKTMQIPILSGREFTAADDAAAPLAVIVNRRFLTSRGLENPLGRAVTVGDRRYQIIGVAENALTFDLKEEARPAMYFSYLQNAGTVPQMTYEIRTAGDPRLAAGVAREIVRDADSRLAIHDMTTEGAHIDRAISTEITLSRLSSVFALIALVIACVGLYGTVAFDVARRTLEIGIRSALGATRWRIVWMVLGDMLVMTGVGLGLGVPLVMAGSRYVKSFLYGIVPNDPSAIAASVGILVLAGLVASYIPASRAARIDPLRAMRCE